MSISLPLDPKGPCDAPSERAMPMITVALVMAHLSRRSGGVFEAISGMAPALGARSGLEIGVFGLDHPALDFEALALRGVRTHAFAVRGPAAFGYAPALGRALRNDPPDLMHVHGLWMYPSIAGMGWRGRRMPYVVTPHGMLDRWALAQRRWKKRLAGLAFETRHLRGAACLHALCAVKRRSKLTPYRRPMLTPAGVVGTPRPRYRAAGGGAITRPWRAKFGVVRGGS
ncbi:MAG: glycosyltransferase [Candidatus Kaistia colombiensis]|nr:MAG: glycosyltransferase [Kaistia sp.]